MATIKVACPKCGQKVSGDETFFGTSVDCPICSAEIKFPETAPEAASSSAPAEEAPPTAHTGPQPVPPREEEGVKPGPEAGELPPAFTDEEVPQAPQPGAEPEEDDEAAIPIEKDEEPGEVPSPMYGAISMVSAVLGIVTCFGGPLFAPIAIIFGHMAGSKAKHSPVQPAPGQTLGAVGMMIGYVNLVFTILGLIVLVVLREMEVIPDGWIRGMITGEEPAE